MLEEREVLVLNTIITEYIHNREPVGSRNVSKIGPLKMSPATIRNIMGDLEEKGYLLQPHTSSGRIPTDMAYRYYADHLAVMETCGSEFADMVHESLEFSSPNLPSMMKEFSKRIGMLTKSVGFVMAAKNDLSALSRIEFTRLNKSSVLAILISKSGFIQNVIIPVDTAANDSMLTRLSNYLNSKLPIMSVSELLKSIRSELNESTDQIYKILDKLAAMEKKIEPGGVFMDGAVNMLNFPEFSDTETLRALLNAFDEKKQLSDILEKCMHNRGVQIFVGREIGFGIEELGVVASTYENDGNILGMVGVIGPKRMEYGKVMKVVTYSSQIIEKMIEQLHGGYSEE